MQQNKIVFVFFVLLYLSLSQSPMDPIQGFSPPKYNLKYLFEGFKFAQDSESIAPPKMPRSLKKGMTWSVTNWPIQSNTWAASVGCSGCDAYNGDTVCQQKLPLLCVIDYKDEPRPFYNFQRTTTKAMKDGGFYNGWTGGYFSATPPIEGNKLKNQENANKICQEYFGLNAQIAQHHMGMYMPFMNDLSNSKQKWDWNRATSGGWSAWGYIKGSLPCGRMWTWINDQNANCES